MIKSTVCYLIRNHEWLMLLRNKKENDVNQNKWIGVGGKMMKDETPYACMKREVFEETGLTVDYAQYCGIVHFHTPNHEDEEIYVYQTSDYHGDMHACYEGTLSYIPQDQVMSLSLWQGDRIFLQRMIDKQIPFDITLHYDEDGTLIDTNERGSN